MSHASAQNNSICTNSDIDVYERDGKTYVVQAGGWDGAWTLTDVSDPAQPVMLHQTIWDRRSYTPDVKAFRQESKDYIVVSMERLNTDGYCGVAIFDVTDPTQPVRTYPADGEDGGGEDWCDVHNLFVEDDASGNGAYIYVTAMAPRDLRVLDISGQYGGVTNPVEIGGYSLDTANYIHDITVLDHTAHSGGTIGRRVYIAYWEQGLVILDADDVTPGYQPTPIVDGGIIDPPDNFRTHHVMASPDGRFVFIQDEYYQNLGQEPVQMWNVSDPTQPTYVDGLRIGFDVPDSAAHNLETNWALDPDRLFVGWYKQGLQAWDYTSAGFVRNHPEPRTGILYHQVQTDNTVPVYSGAWGIRLADIDDSIYAFQSDYRYGLIVDCLTCTSEEVPSPVATNTSTSTATDLTVVTQTATPTLTPTPTITEPATLTLTPTATPTETPTNIVAETLTPIPTLTPTLTLTPTPTETETTTPTATLTSSPTASSTAPPTIPPTITVAPSATMTSAPTASSTVSPTVAVAPTTTLVPTAQPTLNAIVSPTATSTVQPKPDAPTSTSTATSMPTHTVTPTDTPRFTVTPSATTTTASRLRVSQTYILYIDTDRSQTISPGDVLEFEVAITNSTTEPIQNVLFHEIFVSYLSVLPASIEVQIDDQKFIERSEHPSIIEMSIPILASSATAVIRFQVAISSDTPQEIHQLNLQGTIQADGIDRIFTDDPRASGIADPNVLAIKRPSLSAKIYLPFLTVQ
ncbi:hypothetical protein KFU94_39995 [Chloroflexi bacterium TSY]|nr:hypothetical protein [Chloroflexi bacterium TSY]